jgi:bacillithiol biosynthesis deacetylase BshB1
MLHCFSRYIFAGMKLDILAFASHPDDVELGASGTLLRHKAQGKKTGIIDLTRGELGTRGSAADRDREALDSAKLLGLDIRENLSLRDGFFTKDESSLLKIIESIRAYRPEIVLANAVSDRHTDHGKGSSLVSEACFLSGLRKIESFRNGAVQDAWRPRAVYHYIQDRYIHPDLVVDISSHFEMKIAAIKMFRTQFYDPASSEPDTPISSPAFLKFIEGRAREMGRIIGVEFGEGFTVERAAGINDLLELR